MEPTPEPTLNYQLKRYHTVLRDFMAYLHSREHIYPPDHEFTKEELSVITPIDVVKWMNIKLYNTEYPDDEELPLNGNHHTIDYYKKSISYFMPNKDAVWNAMLESGNPTRSVEVNGLLKKVRIEAGRTKKRTSTAASTENPSSAPPSTLVVETPVAVKKLKASLTAVVAAPPSMRIAPATPKEGSTGMHAILLRMHAQNASFIDLFGTLSNSLQSFMTTLQSNNLGIMTEIANLSPTSTNALSDQVVASVGAEGTEMIQPGTAVGTSSGVGWWYAHDDGVKRRVPSTFHFPMLRLEDMYVFWHCGAPEQKIPPMKFFDASDVSFLKRSKTNLSEVRSVMTLLDLEASKLGMIIERNMTVKKVKECCRLGYPGLNIPPTTPDGKIRDILKMRWSSAVRLKNPTGKGKIPGALETELSEAEIEL